MVNGMGNWLADIRHSTRGLRNTPAFTLSVVAILALGIGANAAIFSALDQTVIRPLPYRDPDRLAMLAEDFSAFGMPKNRVSPATFYDWRHRTASFVDLAAIRVSVMNLAEAGAPEQVLGAAATANLLPLVGVPPMLGRVLAPDEEGRDDRIVVLSERIWRRRLGADPAAVGRTIRMSDQPYTIVGVMPAGFHFPDAKTDFWIPIGFRPDQLTARNSHYLRVVGRLRDGASWAAARDDMREIARQLAREFPQTNARTGIVVTPLKDEVTADARHALVLLLGAAGCVLLIACANVANLLIARTSRRQREIAVRIAIGAGRGHIVRHLLTEHFLLAAAGGCAGLIVARWSLTALTRFVPPPLSTSLNLHLDHRAVIFTFAAAAATALLFGAAPALQAASRDITETLKTAIGASVGRKGARLRHSLVVAEIAIAVVLLADATLLIDSLIRLRAVDPGFRADHVLTADIVVPYPKYAQAARRQRFYVEVIARVRALPGVEGVGLTSDLPYTSRENYMSLKIEHRARPGGLEQDALFRLVSPGYLQTIGAKLRAGRFLDEMDGADAMPAVVVNDALARQYWPGESALGRRIDTGTGDGSPLWMTIVGVVEDIKERGLDYGPKPAVYVPFTQTTIAFFQPSEIAVRTRVPPTELASALQQAVWSVDPEQPVSTIRTMDDIVDEELANRQQVLSLLGTFAALALVLAAMGIYAVLSYLVAESRREIGLRIAIGATPRAIVRAILTRSARLTAIGLAVGLTGAAATTRWLGSLLFGVSPVDPSVLVGVSALMTGISLFASFVPARRAAAIDPIVVLRAE
jgi:putative ABC transport system permease protein